jgi:hypothetical protein
VSQSPFHKPVDAKLVNVKRGPSGGVDVIVLDRIEPGETPEYCTHGRVTCHWCDEWCWLGDNSYDKVSTGVCAPMCLQCAHEYIPRGMTPAENVEDHRRTDGPH